MSLLTLNAGSQSIRFVLHESCDPRRKLLVGQIERIGLPGTSFRVERVGAAAEVRTLENAPRGFEATAKWLLEWLAAQPEGARLEAVGHRVVHGLRRSCPARVTAALLDELRGNVPFDPEHLPSEIALMEAALRDWPAIPGIACFDTAFHRTLPRVASLLPLPRRFQAMGIERYGFHGLSYTFLMEELARLGGPAEAQARVVLAHLGNGASLAAVRSGLCIDTSMSFTPTGGLPMSTRSGDLDPSILAHLLSTERLDAASLQHLVTHESGLLGLSGTSSDVRDLLAREPGEVHAAEALALFCFQVRKWIGAFAAALGGLDTLVFAGGIGENASSLRERICGGLEFLGLEIDGERNARHAPLISCDASRVRVRVVRTDEAAVIARLTLETLGRASGEVLSSEQARVP